MTIDEKYAVADEYRVWQRRAVAAGQSAEPLDWYHDLIAVRDNEFRLAVDELLSEDQEPEATVRRIRDLIGATQ